MTLVHIYLSTTHSKSLVINDHSKIAIDSDSDYLLTIIRFLLYIIPTFLAPKRDMDDMMVKEVHTLKLRAPEIFFPSTVNANFDVDHQHW